MRPTHILFALLLTTATFTCGAQQGLPAPLVGGPPSDVPVAVQILRWHMMDNSTCSLMFRSMDQLFTTRTRGAQWSGVEACRAIERALDFTYTWQGRALPAEDFLERTYTNALLVMKDGRIVSESYRNDSDERSRFIGWSMTKSITSVLIGCALAEGRIESLDTADLATTCPSSRAAATKACRSAM